ncbi:MAG TPA: sodium:proline symporter [Noviherbaspirillum sp.]|jgi:hypothetical protein|uniref:sodium:proline symporter n=1 Tax=Noviherbaspirillum sp. TaxID=1926288 RepID=UPI002F942A2F
MSTSQPSRIRYRAAILAGIGAGIIATPVQMLCWWISGYSVTALLLRDTRLAAAIVLGPQVLPPPVDPDFAITVAAGAVHFLLSAAYGIAQGALAIRFHKRRALVAGAVFGLLLFAVNMYGFTVLFPWFSASRDWATVMAHLAFGVSAAALYARLAPQRRRAA